MDETRADSALLLTGGGGASARLLPGRGGLLANLRLVGHDGEAVELLWLPGDFSADGSGWPGGGAPICFPFAGRVFHEGRALHYEMGGELRHMPLHGFAYGRPWRTVAVSSERAELLLAASPQTEQLYPFDFELRATYVLARSSLSIHLQATHLGPRSTAPRMPVAFGLHPYFRAPLGRDSSLADCRLVTSAGAKLRVTPVGGAGKSAPFPETPDERLGRLTDPLFANLILGEQVEAAASLVDGRAGHTVRVAFSSQFRYLVLWSQMGAGFHCLEPWMGLPDAVHNGDGVVWLAPGQTIEASVTLTLT